MSDPAAPFDPLLDLDARHDQLLRQLEDLDRRVQKVLADYAPAHDPSCQLGANPEGGPLAVPEDASLEPPAAAA